MYHRIICAASYFRIYLIQKCLDSFPSDFALLSDLSLAINPDKVFA
jgi:hypothetical protein